MAGQAEFLQMIQELERIAASSENQLTMGEIQHYFEDMNLSESQYTMIYQFLESKHITIVGRENLSEISYEQEETPVETKADPQDDDMARIYIEEARSREPVSEEEEKQLLARIQKNDAAAVQRLIEGYLWAAIDVAGEFRNQGLLYSDLIQEANVGLMLTVSNMGLEESFRSSDKASLEEYLKDAMRRHITEELGVYNNSTRSAMKMADRINELNRRTTAYAKEHGKEGSPEEIAKLMGISEEEVRDLMKISLDAVAVMDSDSVGDMEKLGEFVEDVENAEADDAGDFEIDDEIEGADL